MRSTYKPDLSIVIPALNESKRIAKTLDKLALFIKNNKLIKSLIVEVIIVSADCIDDSHKIIRSKAELFDNFIFMKAGPVDGKGRDVRLGMLKARGKAVIFMDADLATPLKYLPIFYESYLSGNDVVVATRNLKNTTQSVLGVVFLLPVIFCIEFLAVYGSRIRNVALNYFPRGPLNQAFPN